MKNHYSNDFLQPIFKKKLASTVAQIESTSEVEVVVAIKPISSFYYELYLILGVIFAFITFTFFIFAPLVFGDYLIYMGTIASFFIGISFGFIFKPLLKNLLGQKTLKRNVEIMARALFQKGGIHHTKEKIGVLILFSLFEKKHFIVADRKIKNLIPLQEWEKIDKNFEKVFTSKKPSQVLLEELLKTKEIFSKFLPPVENDINELPDDLEIIL